jgi:menaquinone-dependent protoporphyrinogen IX oxidase
MKTLVLYDSAYGNTQHVAQAIGAVLRGAVVRHVDQVKPEDLGQLDYLIVGSPTQPMTCTDKIRHFLDRIPPNGLRGIHVAAFDTRISIDDVPSTLSRVAARLFLHRYAATPIAAALKGKGGSQVGAPEGFFVVATEGPLKAGELERATAWARLLQK